MAARSNERPLEDGAFTTNAHPIDYLGEIERLNSDNARLGSQLDFMRGLALRDQLTGLFSRHYLTDYLIDRVIEASQESNVVLALCDIDDFKAVNDMRGHHAGDIAIACIADILDDLAAGQPVIRWGGEEFLVVLLSVTDRDAMRLCDEMRTEVAAFQMDDGAGEFSCTITLGLCSYDSQLSFEDNVAVVDRALYRGKATGKNRCIQVFHDADDAVFEEVDLFDGDANQIAEEEV